MRHETNRAAAALLGAAALVLLGAAALVLGCDLTSIPGTCQDDASCDDGLPCTTDTCVGGLCSHRVSSGCRIGGACYAAGAKNTGGCGMCNPSMSQVAWAPNNQGGACDDGQPCTYNETCQGGACSGTTYSCDDGLSCTTDTCTGQGPGSGGCTHAQAAGTCLIAGACYKEGDKNPADACQVCDAKAAPAAWSAGKGCARCGNGTREQTEPCDGTDLGGATCASLGFAAGGTLACDAATCKHDTAACKAAWGPLLGVNGMVTFKPARVTTLATDSGGDVYLAGVVNGANVTVGSRSRASAGPDTLFVARVSATGAVKWVTPAAGNWYKAGVTGLSATGNGELVMTGWFEESTLGVGMVKLGSQTHTLAQVTGIAYSRAMAFLAVVNATTGAVTWSTALSGSGGQEWNALTALAPAPGGKVVLGGVYKSTLFTVGSTVLHNLSTSPSHADLVVARFAPSTRTFDWAVSVNGLKHEQLGGIAVSGSKVYLAGTTGSTPVKVADRTHTPASDTGGGDDLLVAALDTSGSAPTASWVTMAGGSGADRASALALDGGGRLYLAGPFASPTLALGSSTLTRLGSGSADLFAARVNPADGSFSWAWQGGTASAGNRGASVRALAPLASGVVLAADCHHHSSGSPCAFGTLSAPAGQGSSDLYVARLGSDGSTGWLAWAGSMEPDWPEALAADSKGHIWVGARREQAAVQLSDGQQLSQSGHLESAWVGRLRGP